MSKFQVILLVVFGVFILVAVAMFALYRGSSARAVTITIWGDVSSIDFNAMMADPTILGDQNTTIRYVEKSATTLEADFTEALARGEGPDLILLGADQLWKNKAKLLPIPYASISERDFKATFIEEGELFLDPSGIYALPLSIDPLVLYYNRDLLSAAGIAKPMAYWDEIFQAATNLSKRDAAGNLVSSIMALGEARNIPHAKEILSALFLQAGTPITSLSGDRLVSVLGNNFNLPISPGESALNFYTQFSNPTKAFYSWNRSLLDAQTNFTSGDSAYYLGFASERANLKSKNPTLNFGVALIPQSRVSGKVITYGKLKGVAISRATPAPAAAVTVATKLVSQNASRVFSEVRGLPPPRRDLLLERPTDAVLSVFYDAALQSRGWLDPDTFATRGIFGEAVESVTSGRARVGEAVGKASRDIETLIK